MIVILQFTPPRTYKIGSSIFSSMSGLKFVSTTRDSLPSMPLTERKKRENVCVYCDSA